MQVLRSRMPLVRLSRPRVRTLTAAKVQPAAIAGRASGDTVTAYTLHEDLTGGDALANSAMDEPGFFGLTLPPYNGDVDRFKSRTRRWFVERQRTQNLRRTPVGIAVNAGRDCAQLSAHGH